MQYLSLLLLILVSFAAALPAQELRTNAEGEKIIVYRDGTARYFNDLTLIGAQQHDSVAFLYPVVEGFIEPLPGGVDPNEADLRRIAERKLQLAREAGQLADVRAETATNNRIALEKELNEARRTASVDATNLERRLQLARQGEENALAERTAAEQREATAERVILDRRYVEAYNEARRRERAGPTPTFEPANKVERSLQMLLPAPLAFSGYGFTTDRRTVVEAPPCSASFQDPVTLGNELSYPTLLFTHTDETLRPYLDGKEYLRCQANVSRDSRGDRYLNLKLTFANVNARTTYGYLPENSSLSLHLLNGRILSLQAARDAVGIIDHGRQELNYQVSYKLPRGTVGNLRGSALDFIRIFWSSGFERYEIYQVEALGRMMECF